MNKTIVISAMLITSLLAAGSLQAARLMSVSYGVVTGISQQERDTSGGSTGGALVGGLLGVASGRGQSRSNRALRGIGGAAVGSAAGRTMARGLETLFDVELINGRSVRMVFDGDFRIGDCVAVEQGGAAPNMRRVASSYCRINAAVPEVFKAKHRREADECAEAMQRLLDARTEQEVRTAQMVMDILCND